MQTKKSDTQRTKTQNGKLFSVVAPRPDKGAIHAFKILGENYFLPRTVHLARWSSFGKK